MEVPFEKPPEEVPDVLVGVVVGAVVAEDRSEAEAAVVGILAVVLQLQHRREETILLFLDKNPTTMPRFDEVLPLSELQDQR